MCVCENRKKEGGKRGGGGETLRYLPFRNNSCVGTKKAGSGILMRCKRVIFPEPSPPPTHPFPPFLPPLSWKYANEV